MKKLLIFIGILLSVSISFAQVGFPNNQNISSPQTMYTAKGGLRADSGMVIATFSDTSIANYGTYIKNTNSIQIRVGDTLYFRDVATSRWVKMVGSNGSTPGCQSGKEFGNVVYDSLLVFHNTLMSYFIGCRHFNAPASTFTLPVTAYTRVDVWIVDTLGTIRVEQGGISGLAYQYNPASELEVASVTIDANQTTPTGISNTSIYKENVHPPEWTGASVMAGVNFAYGTNPFLGDSSTLIPSFANGDIVEWQDLISTYDINDFTFLKFYIRLNAAMSTGAINITFFNGALATTNTITLLNGQYGFNSSLVGSYQLIAIPMGDWLAIFPYQFNLVQFQFTGTGGALQFDNIVLQTGGGSTSTTGVQTWSGANGDVRSGNVIFRIGDDIWSFRNSDLNADSTFAYFRNSAGLIMDSLYLPHDYIFAGTNMNIRDTAVVVGGNTYVGHIFDASGGIIDSAFTWSVLDSLSTPNPTPNHGDIYLVGTSPTGSFVTHANEIATYDSTAGGSYTFQTATVGDLLFNSATTFVSRWTGTVWVRVSKANLHQGGDRYATNIIYGSQDAFGAAIKTNDTIRVQVTPILGNVGIGPSPSTNYRLAVDGTVYSNGASGQIAYWLENGTGIRWTGTGTTNSYIDGNAALGGNMWIRAENIRLQGSTLTSAINFSSDTWVDANKSFGYRISSVPVLNTNVDSILLRVNDNQYARKIGYRAANNLMNDDNAGDITQWGEPAASAILELRSTTRGLLIPRMTAVQRNAIVLTGVGMGTTTPGTGYADGVYVVNLTGGSGTGATARIKMLSGVLNSFSLVNPGTGYAIGNVLSGTFGGGSGFTYTLSSLSGPAGMLVFDTDSASTFQLSSGSTWQNLYNTGGGGGGSETWQQTLINGSQFSQDNTVDLNGSFLKFQEGGRDILSLDDNDVFMDIGAAGSLIVQTPSGSILDIDAGGFHSSISSKDGTAETELLLEADGADPSVGWNLFSTDGTNQVSIVGEPITETITYTADKHIFPFGTFNAVSIDPPHDTISIRHVTAGGQESLVKLGDDNGTTGQVQLRASDNANGLSGDYTFQSGGMALGSIDVSANQRSDFNMFTGSLQYTTQNTSTGTVVSMLTGFQVGDHPYMFLTSQGPSTLSDIQITDTAINIHTPLLRINGVLYSAGGGGINALDVIGSTPNANAATITGTTLNLEPASASFGGVVTTGTQTFAGAKTFGALTATTYNGNTFTAGTGVLTIAAGKTLTASNTLTFAGTDGSTLNIGTGGTLGSNAFTSTGYLPLAGGTMVGSILATDNLYDLGASGATRFRTGYFGTSIFNKKYVGGTVANDTLSFQGNSATSGNTAGNANIKFNVNNNGGWNAMKINNDSRVYMTSNSGGTGDQLTVSDLTTPNTGISIISTNGTTVMRNSNSGFQITSNFMQINAASQLILVGKLSIGSSAFGPSALLHLAAPTATANTASLKLNEGTRQTTPEDGTVNYVANNLEFVETSTVYTLAKTLTNTATLDFGSTAAGAATDLTITVTGAADGDAVSVGVPNGSTVANGSFTAWCSAANTVTVRFSNSNLVTALDPASGTFRVSVIKY